MKKTSIYLAFFMLVIILVTIGIGSYFLMKKSENYEKKSDEATSFKNNEENLTIPEQENNTEENSNEAEEPLEKIKTSELEKIEEFLNSEENWRIVEQTWQTVDEMPINAVVEVIKNPVSEEEKKSAGLEKVEIETSGLVGKLTIDDLKKFIELKTNQQITDSEAKEYFKNNEWEYIEQYDAYYGVYVGNLIKWKIKCKEGVSDIKNIKKIYTEFYTENEEKVEAKTVVTLEKVENGYVFVSNQ